jgi:hypothetical protein
MGQQRLLPGGARFSISKQKSEPSGSVGAICGGDESRPARRKALRNGTSIIAVGGEATRGKVEPQVESLMRDTLRPGDQETMARGLKRWQVMIRRARKHLVSEGWIEDGAGPTWRITSAGRRAADEPLVTEQDREVMG